MIQPEKRMVFHFYITEGWENSITNKIHLECLKRYSHVFDEVIFVITLDDTSNYGLIRSLEMALLNLGLTPRITFRIENNTYLRDSKTFYDFIASKLGDYNGLTFFAHNKGTSNLSTYNVEQMLWWITSMYFLSLEYIDEVVTSLTEGRELSYGSLLNEIVYDEILVTEEGVEPKRKFMEKTKMFLGKNKYQYMGTFFWLNELTLLEHMEKNDIPLPKLTDRWYAENFCPNLYGMEYAFSHRGRFSKNYLQEGAEIESLIQNCMDETDYKNYLVFKEEIRESLC